MEVYQLAKLPVLFAHFHEHKIESPEISFAGFLKLHYTPHKPDADHERDDQLPFKTCEYNVFHFTSCSFENDSWEITPPVPINIEYSLFKDSNKSLPTYSDIFQPPRLV